MKIKKGDRVVVITGQEERRRPRKGQGHQAYPERQRVLVEGVNRIKRHTKVGTPAAAPAPAAS